MGTLTTSVRRPEAKGYEFFGKFSFLKDTPVREQTETRSREKKNNPRCLSRLERSCSCRGASSATTLRRVASTVSDPTSTVFSAGRPDKPKVTRTQTPTSQRVLPGERTRWRST